jgi:hypothetical protein
LSAKLNIVSLRLKSVYNLAVPLLSNSFVSLEKSAHNEEGHPEKRVSHICSMLIVFSDLLNQFVPAMTNYEKDDGASGKIILFFVFGVFPLVFMLLVFVFGPMLGLRFGA